MLAFFGGIGLTAYVIALAAAARPAGRHPRRAGGAPGDAGPVALLVLAALLLVGGFFSIGQGNGWFAPLWLIARRRVAWLVLVRRDRVSASGVHPA